MVLTSEELRAHVEAALRALAPAPYQRIADGDLFLSLPNPNGAAADLYLKETDGSVYLIFGPGGMIWYFFSKDEQGRDTFTEVNLKDALKGIVEKARGVLDETVFAAYYKRFFIPIGGLYPVSQFEVLSTRKDFESMSWNGTYTVRRKDESG